MFTRNAPPIDAHGAHVNQNCARCPDEPLDGRELGVIKLLMNRPLNLRRDLQQLFRGHPGHCACSLVELRSRLVFQRDVPFNAACSMGSSDGNGSKLKDQRTLRGHVARSYSAHYALAPH